MADPAPIFDDRATLNIADAAVKVLLGRTDGYPDAEAVWTAFAARQGADGSEYIQRIRAGGKYIFYALLQKLYDFAEEVVGEGIARGVGESLAEDLLRSHMPSLLHAATRQRAPQAGQLLWLVNQFLETRVVWEGTLRVDATLDGARVRLAVSFRLPGETEAYLKRSGHNPERAFANSFRMVEGAFASLMGRTLVGFESGQVEATLQGTRGELAARLDPENRFFYEGMIQILLDYVERLRRHGEPDAVPGAGEAKLCLSPAMRAAWDRIQRASRSDETVLLGGESGTGKSYFAEVLHRMSARADGPFIEVGLTSDVGSENMIQSNLFGHVKGAFTGAESEKRGLFSLADGGTIFLDEVGDASPELQAKLLRVLEKRCFKMLGGVEDVRVDVRIVAATNRDLAALVKEGRFREDLFYRLNVIRIDLPPLRERPEDLPALVGRLFRKVCRDARKDGMELSAEAVAALCAYEWPGNIRQLENALRHAVAFADDACVLASHLPPPLGTRAGPDRAGPAEPAVVDGEALARVLAETPPAPGGASFSWPGHVDFARRAYLRALLHHHGGNLSKVAEHWDRSSENTLLKLVRAFELEGDLKRARDDARKA